MAEPKLLEIHEGWMAMGEGWAVRGTSKEEAIRLFHETEKKHEEIDALPMFYERAASHDSNVTKNAA